MIFQTSNSLLAESVQWIHIVADIRKQFNSGRRIYKPRRV